jgi:flagellar assembly factor FliW
MALVQTTRFGSLEAVDVDQRSVLHFPEGIPGFEDFTDFALIEESRFWPFTWLQPLAEPAIAFVLMDPGLFIADYHPDLGSENLECLNLQADDIADLRCILVVPSDPKAATANVEAPLVINRRARRVKQVILMDDRLALRHPVFEVTADEELVLSASCSS